MRRDKYGRFVNENKDRILSTLADILYYMYISLPMLILLFVVYKYMNISDFFERLLIEIACGKKSCECLCNGKGNNF